MTEKESAFALRTEMRREPRREYLSKKRHACSWTKYVRAKRDIRFSAYTRARARERENEKRARADASESRAKNVPPRARARAKERDIRKYRFKPPLRVRSLEKRAFPG